MWHQCWDNIMSRRSRCLKSKDVNVYREKLPSQVWMNSTFQRHLLKQAGTWGKGRCDIICPPVAHQGHSQNGIQRSFTPGPDLIAMYPPETGCLDMRVTEMEDTVVLFTLRVGDIETSWKLWAATYYFRRQYFWRGVIHWCHRQRRLSLWRHYSVITLGATDLVEMDHLKALQSSALCCRGLNKTPPSGQDIGQAGSNPAFGLPNASHCENIFWPIWESCSSPFVCGKLPQLKRGEHLGARGMSQVRPRHTLVYAQLKTLPLAESEAPS